MKSVIVDLNGALLDKRPFDHAHKRWFELMSFLLDDKKIEDYAFEKGWFERVDDVMDSYLGDVGIEFKTSMARMIYGMAVVSEVRNSDMFEDFVRFLYGLKGCYEICLVTTLPEPEPVLDKLKISDLFDVIYKSPLDKRPDKLSMIKELIIDYDPYCYIGFGDRDLQSIGELGIMTISVSWAGKGISGDHDFDSVDGMEELF